MSAPLLTAGDEAAALELLHELGCTDGLPVVVPTPERVERFVVAFLAGFVFFAIVVSCGRDTRLTSSPR